MKTQIQSHDHVAALIQALPQHKRHSEVRVLTRRGWRSVTHLKELADSCKANGVDATSAFRFLGLA